MFHISTSYSHKGAVGPVIPALLIRISILDFNVISETIFSIDEEEHQLVEDELRDMVKERFEDPNVVEKTLNTLRDSVRLVTALFDNVRKKNHGEN